MSEKAAKLKLENVQERIKAKRDGLLPDWIKDLHDVAEASRTLRVKIQKKQKEGADQMSFRERMLFFAAGAAEAKQVPPQVRKLNPNQAWKK